MSKKLWFTFHSQERYNTHFDLAQYLWLSESIHNDGKDISTKEVLGVRLTRKLTETSIGKFTSKDFKKFIPKLKLYLEQEGVDIKTLFSSRISSDSYQGLSSKAKIYLKTIELSADYVRQQNIDVLGTRIQNPIVNLFRKEYTTAYNVLIGIGRFLGFDPLTFTTLSDQSFLKATRQAGVIKFIRHEPFGPTGTCIDAFLQILTDDTNHGSWGVLSQIQTEKIVNAFKTLINIDKDITKSDIDSLFKTNTWLYQKIILNNWYKNSNFQNNLQEFNDRKSEIKKMSLIEFLSQDGTNGKPYRFPIAKARFYDNVITKYQGQLYSLLENLHQISAYAIDYLVKSNIPVINFDYIYTKLLFDQGYPIKNL